MTGCLLFGPPGKGLSGEHLFPKFILTTGTGKTLVVRALAKEAGVRMMTISPSDVMDMVRRLSSLDQCLLTTFPVCRRRREARSRRLLPRAPPCSLRRLPRRD